MDEEVIYDDYHELFWTRGQAEDLLRDYLAWCKENSEAPEVATIEEVDKGNIGHIAYHAMIQRSQ